MLSRRALFRLFASLAAVGGAGASYAAWTQSRNPYYSGPVSDHFDGVSFFNPRGRQANTLGDTLRWHWTCPQEAWPDALTVPPPAVPPARVEGEALRVTFIGHATALAQTAGLNILIDPVWSQRASPFGFIGPRRVTAHGVAFADLPRIDVVLLTHNHYDHMDMATLTRLHEAFAPRIVTPLGNDAILLAADRRLKAEAYDWGESTALSPQVRVHLAPAHHWSSRGLTDRRMALWASFVPEARGGPVYFGGDSGLNDGHYYKATADRFAPFRFAFLPIGAYAPRWFMSAHHQDPDEAARAHLILKSAHTLAHHWGAFPLADEGPMRPVEALRDALAARDIASTAFRALRPGEVWDVPVLAQP